MEKKFKIAWISTHPIQYQAPLLREIANMEDVELNVIYFSDFSVHSYTDKEFNQIISWDVPLLDGYKFEFINNIKDSNESFDFLNPRVTKLKKIITKNKYNLVIIQGWNHYGYLYAAFLAYLNGIDICLRCEATDHVNSSAGIKKILRELSLKILFKYINFFGIIGKHNEHFYLKRNVKKEKFVRMPYCVDNQYFKKQSQNTNIDLLRRKYNLSDNRPVILYASKLTKRKNADILIEGYRLLQEPRPYLIIVGDGELRSNIDSKIKEFKLEQTTRMLGFQNQSQLPSLYALADIFVLTSINETWGLVVNEAMNAGCAILISDKVGSALDLVKQDVNGIVISKINPLTIFHSLTEMLKNEKYKKMGERSIDIISTWGFSEVLNGINVIKEQITNDEFK